MERVYAEQAASAAGSSDDARRAAVNRGASVANQGATSHPTSNSPSRSSGDGSELPVLAVTALAGLALGAAGSTASRRLRHHSGLTA